jgi:hypothetical protein
MPDLTIKVPDQPGSSGNANEESSAETQTLATQSVVPAQSGASVQSIIAAYRSLDQIAREIAKQVLKVLSDLNRLRDPVLITTGDADLRGLAKYETFRRSVESCREVLARLQGEAEERPRRARAAGPAAVAVLGDVISKVIKPLAPAFAYSDEPLTIEASALLTLVAGAAAGSGVRIMTPFSISLLMGRRQRLKEQTAELTRLRADAAAFARTTAALPEADRTSLEASSTATSELLDALEKTMRDDPEITRGAAVQEAIADGVIVHVTVFAAGTQLYERKFLWGVWRRHTGGVAGAYAIYTSDGVLHKGGLVETMQEQR